jgi:hypothetical protein
MPLSLISGKREDLLNGPAAFYPDILSRLRKGQGIPILGAPNPPGMGRIGDLKLEAGSDSKEIGESEKSHSAG